METMNTNHVVLEKDLCKCLNCGRFYCINMPVPLSIFSAIVKEFLKMHRDCKKGWK